MSLRYLALSAALAASAAWANPATPPALGSPVTRYITPDDYPHAALRARQQGRVAVRLDVNGIGRVTGCTITASSRSAILDAATCRILRSRLRFEPARDAGGAAVPGTYDTFVDWMLPGVRAPRNT